MKHKIEMELEHCNHYPFWEVNNVAFICHDKLAYLFELGKSRKATLVISDRKLCDEAYEMILLPYDHYDDRMYLYYRNKRGKIVLLGREKNNDFDDYFCVALVEQAKLLNLLSTPGKPANMFWVYIELE